MDELLDVSEEPFVFHLDFVGLCRQGTADADETVHTALFAQVTHLSVELVMGHAALEDVAEDESLFIATTRHEVEGNVKGVDI